MNVFILKTVTSAISPAREPRDPLFSETTQVPNFQRRRGKRLNNNFFFISEVK